MSDKMAEIKSFLSTDNIKRKLADNYINMILKLHPKVPPSQIIEHLNMVQMSGANPYKKQVYFVSYSSKKLGHDVGATVFSYRFFEDQANKTNEFEGCTCVIEVGDYFDPIAGESKKTLKAMAVANRKGRKSVEFVAWYPEFVQTGWGGEPNAIWKSKPHTMLRKCAIAGALRSQFPETLGSFIIEDEYGSEHQEIAENQASVETDIEKAKQIEHTESETQERIDNSTTKDPVIERIEDLFNKITSGFTIDKKARWMNENLLIDNMKRLKSKDLAGLKNTAKRLEGIVSKPIVMER